MKCFKKRTIALILASVVTVAGAFGADNFRNSLMGLKFEASSPETINLVVQTKVAYDGNVTPMRKDANTYVIMLPEMDSQATTPNLKNVSSNISSVNIRTMPYSNTAKGYTKITIKTLTPTTNISATNQIFIRTSDGSMGELPRINTSSVYTPTTSANTYKPIPQSKKQREVAYERVEEHEETEEEISKVTQHEIIDNTVVQPNNTPTVPENTVTTNSNGSTYAWLWIALIVLGIAFFYTRAKDKMLEIAGERIDLNLDDDIKPTKENNKTQSKTSTKPVNNEYTSISSTPIKTAKPAEELNIVDLDELFQEHKAKSSVEENSDENDALEDFLCSFSFDDSEEEPIEETEPDPGYDIEIYEKIINSNSSTFSKDDVNCINQLLNSEINDETIRNIDKYVATSPIKKISKKERLEELVTTYAISQNISFTIDDVRTLYKLISVEIDNDFITDLRTNPQRTEEMKNDILAFGDKPKKPSEIITLSVKDMLPDLSEALKIQGDKKIESNHKAETVYFSEGYDVSILTMNDLLPDLSKEINKKESYISKPSAKIETVDNSYVVGSGTLKISSELPDLKDALENPEKYEKEVVEVIVDEEALLNNITNVQFKPFYDGTNDFEVLNDFSDTPSVSDIQQEFSQFEGFEISAIEDEVQTTKSMAQDDYDDFQALYSNEYVDLDNNSYKDLEPKQTEKEPVYELEVQQPTQEINKPVQEFEVQQPIQEISKPAQEPKVQQPIQEINKPAQEPKVQQPVQEINKPVQEPKVQQPKKTEVNPVQSSGIRERSTLSNSNRIHRSESTRELLKNIESSRIEREVRKARLFDKENLPRAERTRSIAPRETLRCIIDNASYTVLSSVAFDTQKGCHLAKSENGYAILGYIENKLTKISEYSSLKSEKIHARINEELADGTKRYIVRIGLQKLIVEVKEDDIKFVMDL